MAKGAEVFPIHDASPCRPEPDPRDGRGDEQSVPLSRAGTAAEAVDLPRTALEAQLVHLTNYDPLTGLLNRHGFQKELDARLAVARNGGARGALLCLDLDDFKDVNNGFGHVVGDRLLVSVARLLRAHLRRGDIPARLGGDEFAVYLPGADAAEARATAARILEVIGGHTLSHNGSPIGVTASLGVAHSPEHGTTTKDLFVHADLAMYQAKRNGRNHFRLYAPDGPWERRLGAKFTWEKEIRHALERDLFVLYCQPILDLHSDQISGYELLLRMRCDGGAIVEPGVFLPVAERFGLIHAVDRWVVRRAVQLLGAHAAAGHRFSLAVNLSGKAFTDAQLLPLIERELRSAPVDPSQLIMEITESAAIADLEQACRFIVTLKNLGCRFALDDFGVGFSSFYTLKHLPVDCLKIDGSFIRHLAQDPVDQHLVKTMVQAAHGLGKEATAEFVEDAETLTLVRAYGLDFAQGFHLGRPAEVSQVLPPLPQQSAGRR